MTAAAAEVVRPPDTVAGKILRVVAKAPVHLVLAFIGILWLIPTLGLLAPMRSGCSARLDSWSWLYIDAALPGFW